MKYVNDEEYAPSRSGKDIIATIRSLTKAVILCCMYLNHIDHLSIQIRNSNVKKQRFSEYVKKYLKKDYQLLRDVPTRWSSTLLMIERVLLLKNVCTQAELSILLNTS
jgi:hypothetical protein